MTRVALDRNEPSLYSMMLTAQLGHHLLPLSNWTLVAAGDALLTHLFKLFFTWDTTLTRLFHRRLLTEIIVYRQVAERPYENQLDAQFCSELLVNSILAYATALFFEPIPTLNSEDFAREAHSLLDAHQGDVTLSLLQAVAIMSTYEQAFGDGKRLASLWSRYLIHLPMVNARFLQSLTPGHYVRHTNAQQAISLGLSGLYCFNIKTCVIAATNVPRGWAAQLLSTDGNEPSDLVQVVERLWTPYPISNQPQISYAAEALVVEYSLVRLMAECLDIADSNRNTLMPDHSSAKNIYSRLRKWHELNAQRFQGQGSVIPSWIAILVLYHCGSIRLLEPFVSLPFIQFRDHMNAAALCQMHSEAIILALTRSKDVLSARHDFWLSYACSLAVKHLLLRSEAAGPGDDYLWRGCELLYLAGQYMPEANRIMTDIGKIAAQKGLTLSKRVWGLLQASTVSLRNTVIGNTSYVNLLAGNLGLSPAGRIVFKRGIETIE